MARPSSAAALTLAQAPKRRNRRTRMVSKMPGDSFFSNEASETSSVFSDASSTISSSSSTSSSSTRSSRRRIRAVTLLPGHSIHDAFFGSDDMVRENFDQEAAVREVVSDRRHFRSTTSTLKPGRPILPRYAEF